MFVRRSLDNIDSEDLESFEYRGNGRNITNVINSQFDMSNFSFNGVSVSPSYSYSYAPSRKLISTFTTSLCTAGSC